MPLKFYLAGPEVFLPNAREMLDRKAAMARTAGFVPLSPGDLKVEQRGAERRGGKVVVGNAQLEAIYTDTSAFAECLRLIAGQRR